MPIHFNEIDLFEIFRDLGRICNHQKQCKDCKQKDCLVEYGRSCVNKCALEGIAYVENWEEDMPKPESVGEYEAEEILRAISHLLVQCKTCKEEHFDSCIISVLRNCLEQILMKETLPYEGIPLGYMVEFSKRDEEKAKFLLEEYRKRREEA